MDKKEFIADEETKKLFPNAQKIVISFMKDGEVIDEVLADTCWILILDNEGNRIQEIYGDIKK
ncbi:MAG: hypothetical protein EOM50_06875 [Erysipelotrichia bacterium]|nr:hypothetical protein [Erysipelotrichia bacterium]NCC55408.1 hypothetical protein [Erysipelotrichia bacterium]